MAVESNPNGRSVRGLEVKLYHESKLRRRHSPSAGRARPPFRTCAKVNRPLSRHSPGRCGNTALVEGRAREDPPPTSRPLISAVFPTTAGTTGTKKRSGRGAVVTFDDGPRLLSSPAFSPGGRRLRSE